MCTRADFINSMVYLCSNRDVNTTLAVDIELPRAIGLHTQHSTVRDIRIGKTYNSSIIRMFHLTI